MTTEQLYARLTALLLGLGGALLAVLILAVTVWTD
jgi:hypothetical protein